MKKEVKTSVDGLEIGMYVSRLDKPWLKTPFELQGFHIRSDQDIERLRKYCNYVYVDVEAGASPAPRFWVLREGLRAYSKPSNNPGNKKLSSERKVHNEYTTLRKTTYANTVKYDAELKTASQAYENISSDFQQLLANLSRGAEIDLTALNESISNVVDSIIRNPDAMALVIKLKQLDDYTYTRSLGTSVWCATFGRHLGLDKQSIESLALGGLLLDTGKSQIPLELLKKKGALSPGERDQMRAHVDFGLRMLAASTRQSLKQKLPMDVLQMIASHHERADGSGYPQGLSNSEIPIFGRIAGIVGSFDAMTSRRPYVTSGPMPPHEAIAELYGLRGKTFQAELVEQFIQTVGLYPTGSLVELNTGAVGAVIAVNGLRRLRPSIMLLLDENKEPLQDFKYVDLSLTDESLSVATGLPPGAYGIDMKEVFL
jgi:HD-GYP domain-containing protein (c-di-GMP phosphodiesterase class II)